MTEQQLAEPRAPSPTPRDRPVGDDGEYSSDTAAAGPLAIWLVPPIIVTLVPALWWTWADAPFPFRLDLFLTMTLLVALVTVSLLAVLSRGFKHRIRWALGMTSVVVAITFQWPAFTSVGSAVSDLTNVTILGDAVPVALAASLIWLTARLASDWYFAAGAAAVALGVFVVLGTTAVSMRGGGGEMAAAEGTPGPDVLVLVLDGYGRADWLDTEFDIDNTAFLSELRSRGFSIAPEATANYATTYAAVSSMLNLDYVFDAGSFTDDEWNLMRAVLTGRSGLIPTFKAAGYETVYLENAWGGSQCGPAIDHCVRDGLAERSLWNLSQMTIIAPLMRELRPDPFNSVSFDHLVSLGELISEPSEDNRPRLTVAHTLLPHAPLLLNEDCTRERHNELRRWGSDPTNLQARRNNYGAQVGCVNRLVLAAIDQLLAKDPDAVIMITADHGPASTLDFDLSVRDLSDATIHERMKILSAYRLPGCQPPRADLTPVNGARITTDCALDTDLGEVPDHNFWAISMDDPVESVASVLHDGLER